MFHELEQFMYAFVLRNLWKNIYIKPAEPAVNPTIRKKVNSVKSLGKELTNKLI